MCTKLEVLFITGSSGQLGDEGLLAVPINCSHLRELNVSRHIKVTDASMVEVVKHCQLLQYLNLNGTSISDVTLHAIANSIPSLRYLNASFCRNITNAGIVAVAIGCSLLEYLSIDGLGIVISHTTIIAVAQAYPLLRELTHKYCHHLTNTNC